MHIPYTAFDDDQMLPGQDRSALPLVTSLIHDFLGEVRNPFSYRMQELPILFTSICQKLAVIPQMTTFRGLGWDIERTGRVTGSRNGTRSREDVPVGPPGGLIVGAYATSPYRNDWHPEFESRLFGRMMCGGLSPASSPVGGEEFPSDSNPNHP